MRLSLVLVLSLVASCESGARSERPAAAPDASSPLEVVALTPTAAPASASAPSTVVPSTSSAPRLTSAAASALDAPSVPDKAPRIERNERRVCRVAFIGDSLTERRVGGGYVRYLAKQSPESSFVSFAKGGAMVNQMKRQLDAMLADAGGAFTHLVVFGGVNDLYSDETAGRTVKKIERDLTALYAAGRSRGLRVVAITVAPWGGFDKYYNARRGAATRELNAWILAGPERGEIDIAVDAYTLLACGDPERLCPRFTQEKNDGLHFGKLGHETLGQALYDAEFSSCA